MSTSNLLKMNKTHTKRRTKTKHWTKTHTITTEDKLAKKLEDVSTQRYNKNQFECDGWI